ncbi:tRNA (adenosine(37)-N6)-dimethylallyltransferase MiaA [Olivibacter sitiensis]|uniref:tRNA (adenosine(37)-N6)-dimethylallyltransferase MiaA n=1 Tax=Olivibacter sitiensis TaxID=376470 RepID=UPI0003FA8197|nr:tRNA (adenosine(37)-N6)-dimethylallyltransferase MiaA [Olivibacter sitiensis]
MVKKLIVILGPTASGKTALAVALAKRCNGAIISADSRQVYRGMDIGTGKDLAEYGDVPHYLINIREAGESYNVAHFQDDFADAYEDILAKGKQPILCGGTGLYIQSVLQQYSFLHVPKNVVLRKRLEQEDTEQLTKLFVSLPQPPSFKADIGTRKRLIRAIEIAEWSREHHFVPIEKDTMDYMVFGLALPVDIRRELISQRLDKRLQQGLTEEVAQLQKNGVSADQLLFYGLEYKYITLYLSGVLTFDAFYEKLKTEIHRFAKRQMTYFRKMEKDGLSIHWLDGLQSVEDNVRQILSLMYQS